MAEATGRVKRELVLDGLDCANCAMKIEDGVKKMEGIASCSVNFVKQTLTYEADGEDDELASKVKHKIKKLEPHINVLDPRTKQGASSGVSRGHGHPHERGHHHAHGHDHAEAHGEEGHSHGHDHGRGGTRVMAARLLVGAALTAAGMLLQTNAYIELAIFLVAYLVAGGDIVLQAVKNMLRGQVFDEYFLMSLATIGAFGVGQYPEGVAVMLFYQLGEMFQGIAVNRSRKSISAMMDLRPDYANVKTGGDTRRVSPEEVQVGDHIVVKPGEKVPLDGIVVEGSSMVDTSALTGESVPRGVGAGQEVLSGFINKNGVLTIEVSKDFGESTVSKILDLVQNASSKKAATEKFITKFARYYTPVVVIVALLLALVPPLFIQGASFAEWIYRALIFLVISCPCALVVSIPLGFFGGIGAASKSGILVKGSNYLEALNDVKYVVFDKTGTLTKGAFKVTNIHPALEGLDEAALLEIAAHAEYHSTHPIAESIRTAYGKELDETRIEGYNEISGHGVQVKVGGKEVWAGNAKLMEREALPYEKPETAGTIVHIGVDGQYAGYITISDEVKEDAAEAVRTLKEMGKTTVMLTGDARSVGDAVGRSLGLDEIHAELLPQHKVEEIEKLDARKSPKEKIVFVGDGINDTPVLARADIGVAMGGLGSDAAIEAADVVIMTDEPSKVAAAIRIAKRTRAIVWQNIIFALGVKAIFLLLGAFGIATMWEAVFSDVGVTLLAVLNAMRVLKAKA